MYYIIVNPASRSGRGKKCWEKIKPILDNRNISYQVYFSEYQGHTSEIITDLITHAEPDTEYLNVIVLGGDGTVNEVLQGITDFKKIHLSYIPTGSSNDLARDLEISSNPVKALEHILDNPSSVMMDIGSIHCENSLVRDGSMSIPDRYFAVSCGIGYDAAICKEAMASPIKNFLNKCGLGKLTYLFIALKQLIQTPYITGELTLGNKETVLPINKLLFLAAMNHKYEGGGFQFAPNASDADGILDLCVVARISKMRIPLILPKGFTGEHYMYEGVDGYQSSSLTLRTSQPLWIHTDGEVRTKADFISVKCNHHMLRFIY